MKPQGFGQIDKMSVTTNDTLFQYIDRIIGIRKQCGSGHETKFTELIDDMAARKPTNNPVGSTNWYEMAITVVQLVRDGSGKVETPKDKGLTTWDGWLKHAQSCQTKQEKNFTVNEVLTHSKAVRKFKLNQTKYNHETKLNQTCAILEMGTIGPFNYHATYFLIENKGDKVLTSHKSLTDTMTSLHITVETNDEPSNRPRYWPLSTPKKWTGKQGSNPQSIQTIEAAGNQLVADLKTSFDLIKS